MTLNRKHIVTLSVLLAIMGTLCLLNSHNALYALNSVNDSRHSEKSFSIMTYNIASYDSVNFPVSKQERLMELIKREKPGIVCFQELSFEKPQYDKNSARLCFWPL